MKVLLLGLAASLLVASCSQSLEQVADTNRQNRIDRANADLPLTSGAADGLGNIVAEKYDAQAEGQAKAKP
jgi:hypothetical protein